MRLLPTEKVPLTGTEGEKYRYINKIILQRHIFK